MSNYIVDDQNEEKFRHKLQERGYGDPQIMEVEPGPEKEMHAHDLSVMSFVISGEFTLVLENESRTYRPGDWCENKAGTLHTEQIGPDGVTALVATK